MRYYKMISNGMLVSVGHGGETGVGITETEYNRILDVISNRPTAPDGYCYKLTNSLEWELCELPQIEPAEELTETEEKAAAYDILMGVGE